MISVKVCLSLLFVQMAVIGVSLGDDDDAAGSDPNDYLILSRTLCRGQDVGVRSFHGKGIRACLEHCNDNKECKSVSVDLTVNKCIFKKACDDPKHDNNYKSYISTKELTGPALPRHYIVALYNDKVLTVEHVRHCNHPHCVNKGKGHAVSFEDKKKPVDKSQRFYAEPIEGTKEFRIRWDGDTEQVLDIENEETEPGARLIVYPQDPFNPQDNQLWHFKGQALESHTGNHLVLQVDNDHDLVTARYKDGRENQEFIFEG